MKERAINWACRDNETNIKIKTLKMDLTPYRNKGYLIQTASFYNVPTANKTALGFLAMKESNLYFIPYYSLGQEVGKLKWFNYSYINECIWREEKIFGVMDLNYKAGLGLKKYYQFHEKPRIKEY